MFFTSFEKSSFWCSEWKTIVLICHFRTVLVASKHVTTDSHFPSSELLTVGKKKKSQIHCVLQILTFLVVLFLFVQVVYQRVFWIKAMFNCLTYIYSKSFHCYIVDELFILLWKFIIGSIFLARFWLIISLFWNSWRFFAMRLVIFADVSNTTINCFSGNGLHLLKNCLIV